MTRTAPPRRRAIAWVALLVFAGFVALGTWQVQRLGWKRALIERVEQRVHAVPVPPPAAERWPAVTAASDEYRRVEARGHFLGGTPVFVQALTELGAGFWVLSPLQLADGSVLVINRGFVPPGGRAGVTTPGTPVTVTGLLRLGEPRGGFLRRNDPAAERWYSRDVDAIATARGWRPVAPYFVDAEAAANPAPGEPTGGLTVIAFNDHHAVYAFTWYTLALMTAAAAWRLMRGERVGRAD